MTIFEKIKSSIELEGIDAYDVQVLEYVNQDINFLNNNNIPVTTIDGTTEGFDGLEDVDLPVVLEYLMWNAMIKLDRSFLSQSATASYIEDRLATCLNMLKGKYDIVE